MDKEIAFMSVPGGGFGDPALATDFPLERVENRDCSVTETWWWSCHVAERNLNCEVYFWKHPNLNVMSGGVWVFQGVKKHHLHCEHFNFKNWLPAPQIDGASFYSPELDLRINILEPMKRHEVIYRHVGTDTSLRLTATSIQPPAMRANNAHFEQAQHMTGLLRLNGEDIRIDCLAMRDRSWGEPRPEASVVHPPTLWAVGISGDGKISFNFNGCDDPERDPVVASYGLSKEQALKIGWIYRDGEFRKVVSLSKLTTRAAGGIQALRYDCTLLDDRHETYRLTGEVKAAVFWSPWPNMAAFFGQLVKWNLNGEEMYGEAQEVFWSDCMKKMSR
jgi:hypothetical protein